MNSIVIIKKSVMIFLVAVIMAGCSDPENLVKKGILLIDPSLTVGDALNNYRHFNKTEWKVFRDTRKRQFVEFSGKININGLVGTKDYNDRELTPDALKTFMNMYGSACFTYNALFVISADGKTFNLARSIIKLTGKKENEEVDCGDEILRKIYNDEPQTSVSAYLNDAAAEIDNKRIEAESQAALQRLEAEQEAERKRIEEERAAEWVRIKAEQDRKTEENIKAMLMKLKNN